MCFCVAVFCFGGCLLGFGCFGGDGCFVFVVFVCGFWVLLFVSCCGVFVVIVCVLLGGGLDLIFFLIHEFCGGVACFC